MFRSLPALLLSFGWSLAVCIAAQAGAPDMGCPPTRVEPPIGDCDASPPCQGGSPSPIVIETPPQNIHINVTSPASPPSGQCLLRRVCWWKHCHAPQVMIPAAPAIQFAAPQAVMMPSMAVAPAAAASFALVPQAVAPAAPVAMQAVAPAFSVAPQAVSTLSFAAPPVASLSLAAPMAVSPSSISLQALAPQQVTLPFNVTLPPPNPALASAEAVKVRDQGGAGGTSGPDVSVAVNKLSLAIEKLTTIADAHSKLLKDHEDRIKKMESTETMKKELPKVP